MHVPNLRMTPSEVDQNFCVHIDNMRVHKVFTVACKHSNHEFSKSNIVCLVFFSKPPLSWFCIRHNFGTICMRLYMTQRCALLVP